MENKKTNKNEVSKNDNKFYENLKITKVSGSKIEITGTVPAVQFESFRKKALENINNEISIDGFRKGKIPENILISKVGDMTILEEMAELALSVSYPKMVIEEKLDVIGRPEIQITKIAKDNPLEFKIISAVVPEIKLDDYKKIAKEEISKQKGIDPVTEKDVDEAILKIRRSRANHDHNHGEMSEEEHNKMIDSSLPEFNDDFVKSLGDFKDINDFKSKVKEMLEIDKKDQAREKKRIAISDKLIETSTIDIPEVLIESENKRIEAQFSEDISRMGIKMDDYLKHTKKSIDDLRKEWRPHAEKKAKLQLILNEIAKIEKISPDAKEIETEVNHITEHYADADRDRAFIYAETVLTNEKVYSFLESQNK
jgi:FKBP-type peptidyl-prolyl cis-trans isomerase (trigger factor)